VTNKRPYLFLIFLLIVVGLLVVPIKIPCTYHAVGRILAARSWVLVRGNDGQLAATLRNNYTGSVESYVVFQASTEGQIGLTIDDRVLLRGHVNFGDTIGYLQASEATEELTRLRSELALAQANLKVSASGVRPEEIRVAECEEQYASAAADDKKRVVDRLEALQERGMVSPEEYEVAKGELTLLELDRDLASAKLTEARAGAKAEELDMIRTQIAGLKEQISVLEERIASFTIIAPITGMICRAQVTDTVLIIHDDSDRLALLALEWNDSRTVASSDSVIIGWQSDIYTGTAKLKRVEEQVQVLEGRQVAYALAQVPFSTNTPPPGTVIQCDVRCGSKSIAQGAKEILISAAGIF